MYLSRDLKSSIGLEVPSFFGMRKYSEYTPCLWYCSGTGSMAPFEAELDLPFEGAVSVLLTFFCNIGILGGEDVSSRQYSPFTIHRAHRPEVFYSHWVWKSCSLSNSGAKCLGRGEETKSLLIGSGSLGSGSTILTPVIASVVSFVIGPSGILGLIGALLLLKGTCLCGSCSFGCPSALTLTKGPFVLVCL